MEAYYNANSCSCLLFQCMLNETGYRIKLPNWCHSLDTAKRFLIKKKTNYDMQQRTVFLDFKSYLRSVLNNMKSERINYLGVRNAHKKSVF